MVALARSTASQMLVGAANIWTDLLRASCARSHLALGRGDLGALRADRGRGRPLRAGTQRHRRPRRRPQRVGERTGGGPCVTRRRSWLPKPLSRARCSRQCGRRCAPTSRSTKPRIIWLLLVTTVPAMVLAERGLALDRGSSSATLIGGMLAAGGANAINQVRRPRHRRAHGAHRERPLPMGILTPVAVRFWFGLALAADLAGVWLSAHGEHPGGRAGRSPRSAFYVRVYSVLPEAQRRCRTSCSEGPRARRRR